MSEIGPRTYHPALFRSVQAQDKAPMDPVWVNGKHVTPPSPAKQLQRLRVNYYGAVQDSPSEMRPHLRDLSPHTIFMGATGSGKTLAMKLHMASVLPPSIPEYAMNFRSLVYDAKTDLLPFFAAMGFNHREHIILTNPFDDRSASWDICEDVDNTADAQSFADIIIQEGTGDVFWFAAAREMVSAAIDGLNSRPEGRAKRPHWTLRHLVHVLDDPELLRQVLVRTEKGRGVAADYLETEVRLRSSLRATLRSHITPYRLIAALWDHADFSFSFKPWVQGGGMLLIGDHYKYKEAMVRANNMLVRYAIDTLMDRHDEDLEHDLTWLYLDELKNAGKFPNFGTMLTQGRSKGIRSVLAAQGLSTLKATFNENEEQEVLNNCGNKAIMQLGSDEDAKWAERLFSTVERVKVSRTIQNDPKQEGSRTLTPQKEARVDAAAFLELPSASDNRGAITAYYHGRGGISSLSRVSSESLKAALPRLPDDVKPPDELSPRPKTAYELRRLGPKDFEHLALVPSNPQSTSSQPTNPEGAPSSFRLPPE